MRATLVSPQFVLIPEIFFAKPTSLLLGMRTKRVMTTIRISQFRSKNFALPNERLRDEIGGRMKRKQEQESYTHAVTIVVINASERVFSADSQL